MRLKLVTLTFDPTIWPFHFYDFLFHMILLPIRFVNLVVKTTHISTVSILNSCLIDFMLRFVLVSFY